MRTIGINGCEFELIKPRKNKVTWYNVNNYINNYTGRTILDCYDRPSDLKQYIFDVWDNWARNCHGDNTLFYITHFEVSSYNCMQFTLSAIARNKETNKMYMLYITRDHNRAYVVE